MTRLPTPGGDTGTWGSILNDFLAQAHNADGTLRANSVGATQIQAGAVTQSTVGLGNVDNTSDANKPVSTATQTALDAKVAKGDFGANVKDYGAKGDGTTDDAAAIQAAINAAAAAGGTVWFPAGVYSIGSTLTLPGGVHLRGTGAGGDVFSDTDSSLPFKGSVVKLKDAANVDLIKTANFDALTGQANPSTQPSRFGIHDLVLDGNKYGGNTSGIPLRIYGKSYVIDHVIVQNGAAGGVYSEGSQGGYEMEAHWSNFRITDNAGTGLVWKGPHDSQFMNGVVARNDGHNGVDISSGWIGGEMFANTHVWGSHIYQWVIGTTNAAFLNCISDGPGGIQLLSTGNQWIGGSILGTGVPGETAITLGNGNAALMIAANNITTRVYNYAKGSALIRIWPDSVDHYMNWFRIFGSLGGNIRYNLSGGMSALAGATTFPVTTLAVSDAATFSATGGNLYISDGSTILTDVSYTGVSGNTLTGVSGGSGTFAAGTPVFTVATTGGQNTVEVYDTDSPTGGALQYMQTNITELWLSPTSFNVGAQTLRPNSSAVAYQQMRNETGRVDMAWDNSGSAGAYSYQNGATVEGRSGTASGSRTWALNAALGTVQTGSGATSGRPSAASAGVGAQWFDTSLNKPIWSDGTNWRDASGTAV